MRPGPKGPSGLAATRYLDSLVTSVTSGTRELAVRTQNDVTEKYDRNLAELIVGDVNINHAVVAAGHAGQAEY